MSRPVRRLAPERMASGPLFHYVRVRLRDLEEGLYDSPEIRKRLIYNVELALQELELRSQRPELAPEHPTLDRWNKLHHVYPQEGPQSTN
jgi:hypothetical protein